MALKYGGAAIPPHRRRQGQGRRLPDARSARPPPRPGDRHLHLRRAPGRPQPVAGDRALHGGRGDVLARGPGGHHRRFAAGRPAGEAGLQRPAGDLQEGHDRPSIRPAVQPGDLLGEGRARLRQQRAGLEPLRPGAELRLLHGQPAPGLAQVRLAPLDEDARRRRSAGGRRMPRASSRRRSRASRSSSSSRRSIRSATRSRSRSRSPSR